jgi:hypothetical protein
VRGQVGASYRMAAPALRPCRYHLFVGFIDGRRRFASERAGIQVAVVVASQQKGCSGLLCAAHDVVRAAKWGRAGQANSSGSADRRCRAGLAVWTLIWCGLLMNGGRR